MKQTAMVPVTKTRSAAPVAAAARLWNRSDELVRCERTLFALQGCFPGFDPSSTLLKVAALSSIDVNRSIGAATMFEHVQRVVERIDRRRVGPEFVDLVAEPQRRHGRQTMRSLTFASRFAHFFLDPDSFPMLDGWTERALANCIERSTDAPDASRYTRFYVDHARLASAFAPARPSDVCRFLWLRGQYTAWKRNSRTPISRAVRALIESDPTQFEELL